MAELSNDKIALTFDPNGSLVGVDNRLTGERYAVSGDEFEVEATDFRFTQTEAQFEGLDCWDGTVQARYRFGPVRVEVTYTLKGDQAFAEKQLALTSSRDLGLKNLVVSQLSLASLGLEIVPYRYQRNVAFFGRTTSGGFFTGMEMPYDASVVRGERVVLACSPSLRVRAGERLLFEPAYFGVYRKDHPELASEGLPLQAESDAMVQMTSVILGPPRARFAPAANGWHCEMTRTDFGSDADVDADLRSVEFLRECGIDWLQESHVWGGDAKRVAALIEDQEFQFSPLAVRFVKEAHRKGVKVVLWGTMNHSNPFVRPISESLRMDKPEWLIAPIVAGMDEQEKADEKKRTGRWTDGNCLANEPFYRWVAALNLEAMSQGQFDGWGMDGDWWTWNWDLPITEGLRPAICTSSSHDHLPPDANYACQRRLVQLTQAVRQSFPDAYLNYWRPPMDLGVWSLRGIDACFTIDEFAQPAPLAGLEAQPRNVAYGDKIRFWSRVRVHRHFFPHWLDQPLLFPVPQGLGGPAWESENLDYILLSAISSSPNLLFYLPTKTGMPRGDKATIRRWMDWGRENIDYIMVRKDLPDWPQPGKVDGSAHLLGDRGLIFLFNPNQEPLEGAFALTEEDIGLTAEGDFALWREYPAGGERIRAHSGQTVRWLVPAESVLVLRLAPA